MPHGYTGNILRVDLTTGQTAVDQPDETFYRRYFGGEGFVAYFLLKEVPSKVDPLSPQNKLIFATGPLTGVPVGGCGRHSVGGKSPLTGGFGEAEAGGYWGAELKMAGYDAIVVEGRAENPVYLLIRDGDVVIKDARHLWGMKTLECQDRIREEIGDSNIKVAQVGPAGENLVRYACVSSDIDAFAGRTGLGAVMGSKNLKAIACRGHQRLFLADPPAVSTIGRWVRDNAPVALKGFRELGTARFVLPLNTSGGLPVRNFQAGSFDGADKISGEAMRDSILVRRKSCFACPVQCKREVKVEEPYSVDPRYGGPEYETIAALGSNCGVDDLKAIAKANELVNAYGVDSISCGTAIAFAMECFENGLITKEDTGGVDLRFGNAEAMLEMIEQIACRKGLGALLAEGVARASQKLGPASQEFAMQIKGQEMSMHEPRWKQGMGIGYAMSPTGADHCHNMHDSNYAAPNPVLSQLNPLGIFEPLPLNDLSPAKMRLLAYQSLWIHYLNCAVCCYFVMVYGLVGLPRMVDLVRAATGWETSVFELMKVGERAANLARAFNIREGFTAQDDNLPQRFFTPHTSGPLMETVIDVEAFQKARQVYYKMMGWENGVPTLGKLAELGIDWASPFCLP